MANATTPVIQINEGKVGIGHIDPLHKLSIESGGDTTALLKLRQTTNGNGAAIEFNDNGTSAGTQNGTITYYHSDSASQGGGSSYWFRGQDDQTLVLANNGRVVVQKSGSTAEVGYGFYDDINTGMYRIAADNLGFATAGVKRLDINGSSATFSGDLTVSGGDITLGGTGRIQGIDTVSSGTDAANKTYVDNAISGVPQGTVTGTGVNNRLAIWNGTTAIDSDSDFFTTGTRLVSTQLAVGDGTDGYFYSDTAGRTAFRDGSFYIQQTVPNYYNYATNQYHGNTSGDNHFFRGNPLTGNNWSIAADGTIEAERGFTTDGLGKSFTWTVNNTTSNTGYRKIMNWYPAGQSSRMTITASGGLGYGNGGDDDSGLANAVFTVNNGNLLSGSWWFEGADGIINFYWKQISTSPYQYEIHIQYGQFSEFALQAVTSDGYMDVANTVSTPSSWTTLTKKWNVNNRLYVDNAGEVGINTASPTSLLNVKGNATGDNTPQITISSGGVDNNAILQFDDDEGGQICAVGALEGNVLTCASNGDFLIKTNSGSITGTTNTRLYINQSGNVGIGTGTGTPQGRLDVNGNINGTGSLTLRSGTATYFSVGNFQGNPFINTGTSGGTIFLGAPASFVTNLNVAGTATATNFILSSDERLKENIKILEPRKIDIKWKSFNLKTDDDYRTGVIAQELEKTNPEFVREDSKGFKSVAYIDLLIAKIAELEARLEKAGI